MIVLGILAGAVLVAFLAVVGWTAYRLDLRPRQAFLYAPLKALYRIRDRTVLEARSAKSPVIYCVIHRSKLDAALMLSLLPDDTLHILDDKSAKAGWLDPWRGLARTIAFNAEHIFLSRRLVRMLKGGSRIAVYIPDAIEPDTKAFRLYRAVARIAQTANAQIVAIDIKGVQSLAFSYADPRDAPRRLAPPLRIVALPPTTIEELQADSPVGSTTAANALFDRVAEARATEGKTTVLEKIREAALAFGPGRAIVQDALSEPLTYRRLLAAARVLGDRFASMTAPGDAVGVLLPNSVGAASTILGLMSAGRVAAMLNFTAGSGTVVQAFSIASCRFVVTSRVFVEKAGLQELVAALEKAGARLIWLEDMRAEISRFERLAGLLQWRVPVAAQKADSPALILFTSGSEGAPKAIVHSHRSILANASQVAARLSFGPRDTLLNVLPIFHAFGLTGGLVLPLISGVKAALYPTPLHYKIIPGVARKAGATILFATDTFLAAYVRSAKEGDFAGIRFAVAGAEPLRQSTRAAWRDRFGVPIYEGYGMTEMAPVVAVNTATHNRDGTVGRLLPGVRARIEPVEGLADGGRLFVSGPNLLLGSISAENPGTIQPAPTWHDTGDIVALDREGYVSIGGRAKRFAKIAGEMVSLGAVDALAHAAWPDDRHVSVSVPDARRGEKIVLVTTRPDPDRADLLAQARSQNLSELMVPDAVIATDDLPLIGTGKIDTGAARQIALDLLAPKAKPAPSNLGDG